MGARKNASVAEVAAEYAAELFAENGVNGTSLSDVAKSCSISKGTLYYYFSSKDALVLCCAETCVKRISDRVYAWMDSFARDASVEGVCGGLVDVFFSEPDELRLFASIVEYASPNRGKNAGARTPAECEELNGVRTLIDSALEEWRVLFEVAALRLPRPASERLAELSASVAPLLIGTLILGRDAGFARATLTAMLR